MDFGDFNIKDFLDRLGAKATMVAVNISPSCEVEVLELTKNGLVNNYTKFSYNYNNISKDYFITNKLFIKVKLALLKEYFFYKMIFSYCHYRKKNILF